MGKAAVCVLAMIFLLPGIARAGAAPTDGANQNGLNAPADRIVEIRVPLRDGRLSLALLEDHLGRRLHIPESVERHLDINVSVNARGIAGWLAVRALNHALGKGFHLTVSNDALVVTVDAAKLPHDWDQTAGALRRLVEVTSPEATARLNRRMGLTLPRNVDPNKPIVILIHGLDGDASACQQLQDALNEKGWQTATFSYPAEQPIADSADLFGQNIADLRQAFGGIRIDIVSESMGGLVARKYIEGPTYNGGVDHFIMIAPPNAGSDWAKYGLASKIANDYENWRHDPNWSASWMISEGLWQSAGDMKPGSKFLAELNAQPRRAGVRYTIIAGDQPIRYRLEAEALAASARIAPDAVANCWGIRQADSALQKKAQSISQETGSNDGPVDIDSAKLAGVSDFVVLPADHVALYDGVDGQPPAACGIIIDRLER